MARRKSKKTRSRRGPKTFSVLGLAESALIANAVTQGMFDVGLRDFFFSTAGGSASSKVGRAQQITGRELLAGLTGGSANTSYTISSMGMNANFGGSLTEAIGENLKVNGAMMVGQLIAIPFGFRAFSKLTTKPRGTLNKALKMGGLPLKV